MPKKAYRLGTIKAGGFELTSLEEVSFTHIFLTLQHTLSARK